MTNNLNQLGQTIANISKIIERDSKTSSYKFALLRSTIEIIQENSPYIQLLDDRVLIPTGLLIEKWLFYYYPLLASKTQLPQITENTKLAFADKLQKVISFYETNSGEGLSIFYNDLKNKGIPKAILNDFTELIKSLRDTITKNPMRYIGKSVTNQEYDIYKKESGGNSKSGFSDVEQIILNAGTFSIPITYYEAFSLFGSFIGGQDSIIFKWAEFTSGISSKKLALASVLGEILKSPVTEREIKASKKLYEGLLQQQGELSCVWTGNAIKKYDIDHLIPFSIWKNNDLWNLLPSNASTNNQKKDKIPSPKLIEQQKDLIIGYWDLIRSVQKERFEKEFRVALIGNADFSNWKTLGIEKLKNSCNYLITTRGFEEWKG